MDRFYQGMIAGVLLMALINALGNALFWVWSRKH